MALTECSATPEDSNADPVMSRFMPLRRQREESKRNAGYDEPRGTISIAAYTPL